jgi:hypothetical protein
LSAALGDLSGAFLARNYLTLLLREVIADSSSNLLALAVQIGLTKLFLLDLALLLVVSVALLLQLGPALLLHYHVGHGARLIGAFHLGYVVTFLFGLGGALLLGDIRSVTLLVVLGLALAVVFSVAFLVIFGVAFIF